MTKTKYSDCFALRTEIPAIDPDGFEKQNAKILEFSIVVKGTGGFDFELRPDPEKVEITKEPTELESALKIFKSFSRWCRQAQFRRRFAANEQRPVLVSEGDSWFQFAVRFKDVVDQLNDFHIIYSVGAARAAP